MANDSTDNKVRIVSQRKIDNATTVVTINKRITTQVTLEICPANGVSNMNVAQAHRNIFIAIKLIEPTVKIITPTEVTIDSLGGLLFEAVEYTSTFTEFIKCPRSVRVYTTFKFESSRPISDVKHRIKQIWK